MPGVMEISRSISMGQAIDDLALISELSFEGEWEDKIIYLPLR